MCFYLVAVGFLCFNNFHSVPDIRTQFLNIPTDKVVHFCMFLPFPVLAFFCYDKVTNKPWQALLLAMATFIAGAAIAGGTELIQEFLPYREGDLKDYAADLIALAVSSTAVFIADLRQMREKSRQCEKESNS